MSPTARRSSASWASPWPSSSPVRIPTSRSGRRLRDRQGWHRHQQHRHLEASGGHEVPHPGRHGRYPGHLRHDRRRHHQPERYLRLHSVKKDTYDYRSGYSHMASGLVCGFSCVVLVMRLRLRATPSAWWETWESARTPSKRSCSWG